MSAAENEPEAEPAVSEKARLFIRLGVVEGKLDSLLALRRDDGVGIRELGTELRATVTSITDAIRQMGTQVTALSTEVRSIKEGLQGLNHIVRDGDTTSLVHRVSVIEQLVDSIRKTAIDDRQLITAEMTRLRGDIEVDLKDLHGELRGFTADVAAREAEAARTLVTREAEATKERRVNNRNLLMAGLTAFLSILVALVTAIIQGSFTAHWK